MENILVPGSKFKEIVEKKWIESAENNETKKIRQWCCENGHKDFYDHDIYFGCFCGLVNKHRYMACEINLEDFD